MWEQFKTYWFNWLLGGCTAILAAAWAWMVKKYKAIHAQQTANNQGTLALLKDRLFQSCTYYIERGYCGVADRENIESLYNAYHAMGGNGTGTDLYNKVRELPLNKEE